MFGKKRVQGQQPGPRPRVRRSTKKAGDASPGDGNILNGRMSIVAQQFLEEGLAPPPEPAKPRRVIKRKPGTVSVNYFTADTQAAIVEFQGETTFEAKNKVFTARIFPAFATLVENLINVYGFHVIGESKEDLRNECIEFLFTTVGKFNASKGTKAFSYFNVVARNFLLIKSKKNTKQQHSHVSLDALRDAKEERTMGPAHELGAWNWVLWEVESQNPLPTPEESLLAREYDHKLHRLVVKLQATTKNVVETEVLRAIGVLTSNLDDIDLLNKRAVLLYLRELTGFNSKQLSSALVTLKKSYRQIREEELNDAGVNDTHRNQGHLDSSVVTGCSDGSVVAPDVQV